jgi:hypothetical protein
MEAKRTMMRKVLLGVAWVGKYDHLAWSWALVAMDLLEGQRSSVFDDQQWKSCMVPHNVAPNCSIAARRPKWKFE